MVEIVLHLVVLWKAQQVAVLHIHQITWACTPNIHFDLEYNIPYLKRPQLYNLDSNNILLYSAVVLFKLQFIYIM